MATKTKPSKIPEQKTSVEKHVSLEMERGSIAVSRVDLFFSVTGKKVQLRKQSPLNLSFDSGKVEYDDGQIRVKAEGDVLKLQLD